MDDIPSDDSSQALPTAHDQVSGFVHVVPHAGELLATGQDHPDLRTQRQTRGPVIGQYFRLTGSTPLE